MNKLIFLFATLFSLNCFCQEDKLNFVEAEFNVEVDDSVYEIKQGNSYYTKTQSSAMQFNLMPKAYEEIKAKMMKSQKEGFKKEVEINGIKLLLMKTNQTNENGNFIIAIYCKKINDDSTLVINSFYKVDEELIMKPIIEKAAISAKLKE